MVWQGQYVSQFFSFLLIYCNSEHWESEIVNPRTNKWLCAWLNYCAYESCTDILVRSSHVNFQIWGWLTVLTFWTFCLFFTKLWSWFRSSPVQPFKKTLSSFYRQFHQKPYLASKKLRASFIRGKQQMGSKLAASSQGELKRYIAPECNLLKTTLNGLH